MSILGRIWGDGEQESVMAPKKKGILASIFEAPDEDEERATGEVTLPDAPRASGQTTAVAVESPFNEQGMNQRALVGGVSDTIEQMDLPGAANKTAVVGATMAAGPRAGAGVGAVSGWMGRLASAARVGGPKAAAQAAGPAIAAAAPVVEAVALQEKQPIGAGAMQAADVAAARLASQRGAALNVPGEAVEKITDFMRNLRPTPGMSKFTMPDDPSMRMDKAFTLLRSRMAGAGETWAERARSVRDPDNPEMDYFLQFLDAKNNEARVAEAAAAGKPFPSLPGGIDPIANNAALQQADAASKGAQAKLLPGIEDMRSEMEAVAQSSGQMKRQGREDYIPNVIADRFQDTNHAQMLADTEAENRFNLGVGGQRGGGFTAGGPGSIAKRKEARYEGSARELEGDPIQRLAWKGAQVERRAMMNQFVDRLKPMEIDTKAPGFVFDRETMGAYDKGNGELVVFPRDIALALSEAGEYSTPSMVQRLLGSINNIQKKGLLKYNPSFQAKQVFDDIAVGMANVPLGRQGEFLKNAKQHAETLMAEFAKVNKGEFSPIIASYRRRGTMNEIFESLVDTQGEIKAFSSKTLGHGKGGLGDWLDEAGQIRETAIKSSLADMYESMGATPERAASLANQVTGDYISKSKSGRELTEFLPMMKWYTNAVKRLTVAALEDPVTAKRNPLGMTAEELKRAASTSPLSKIVPAAIAAMLWNGATTGRWGDYDGLMIPGTDKKIMLPGYGNLIGGVGDSKTLGPTRDALLDRASMALQIPSLLSKQQTLGGTKVGKLRSSMPFANQAREQAQSGGVGLDNPLLDAVTPDGVTSTLRAVLGQRGNPLEGMGVDPLVSEGNLTPVAQKIGEGFFAQLGHARRITSDRSTSNWLDALRVISPLQIQDVERKEGFDLRANFDDYVRRYHKAATDEEKAAILSEYRAEGGKSSDILIEAAKGRRQQRRLENTTPEEREERERQKRDARRGQ